jgi:hypothetical protein
MHVNRLPACMHASTIKTTSELQFQQKLHLQFQQTTSSSIALSLASFCISDHTRTTCSYPLPTLRILNPLFYSSMPF